MKNDLIFQDFLDATKHTKKKFCQRLAGLPEREKGASRYAWYQEDYKGLRSARFVLRYKVFFVIDRMKRRFIA